MKNQDWERFGEDIKRSVQDAVDSGDFSRLNQTITNTVNGAADAFADTMRNVGDRVNQNRRPRYGETFYGMPQYEKKTQQKRANSQNGQVNNRYSTGGFVTPTKPVLYRSTSAAKVGAIVMSVCGYMMSGFNFLVCISAVIALVVGVSDKAGVLAVAIIFGILGIATTLLGVAGTKKIGGIKRFRQYLQTMGGKEYCDIRRLAEYVGKNEKYVLKDIKNMIRRGWFIQGHLDAKEKCLIASHDAYSQYTDMMEQQQEQKDTLERQSMLGKMKNMS